MTVVNECPVCGLRYELEHLPQQTQSRLQQSETYISQECDRCGTPLQISLMAGLLQVQATSSAATYNPFLSVDGWFRSLRQQLPAAEPRLIQTPLWQDMHRLLRWFQQIGKEAERLDREMTQLEQQSYNKP